MARLVLTRKKSQSIIIHKDDEVLVQLTVTKVDGNQVRLCLDADKAIKIDRKEVYEQKN